MKLNKRIRACKDKFWGYSEYAKIKKRTKSEKITYVIRSLLKTKSIRSLIIGKHKTCLITPNNNKGNISRFCNQEILPLVRTIIGRYLLQNQEILVVVGIYDLADAVRQYLSRTASFKKKVRDRIQKIFERWDWILIFI